MKKIILVFCLQMFALCGYGQNLVANWSFEDTIPCIVNPFPGDVSTAPPWQMLVQTPDFQSGNYCGTPFYYFGYQSAKSGISFGAAGVFDSSLVIPGLREVFGQELQNTLISGHKYCVSFYVNLANDSKFAVDKIGALFTTFEIDQPYFFTYTLNPQIESPSGSIIDDTLNWVEISGDFIAQGGEKFISVGNFRADGNFQFMAVPWNFSNNGAYYYFDDISVIDCTVGIEENVNLQFNVLPNLIASDATFKIKSESELISYQIFSITGQLIKEVLLEQRTKEIEINAPSNPGVYVVELFSRMGSVKTKIMVY